MEKKWHGLGRAWTRLFHVVKRIRCTCVTPGFERAFLAKLEPGLFPLSFPLSFPSFPLPWRRFSPSLCAFGMTLIARMKHEWNKWNEWNTKERRMKQNLMKWWMKHAASTITAGVSAAGTGRSSRCRNCDGCFDFHCRFPTSLSSSSWLCKNAQGWPQWPGVAAEFVVVCEARKRLLSARTECEACIQIVLARRGNQNLPSPQELRTSRRIWYLRPSTDHWRFLVSK